MQAAWKLARVRWKGLIRPVSKKKFRLSCDIFCAKFSLGFGVSGDIYVSLRFSLVMFDMSKYVEIAILTAKARENFAQKMSHESRIFFFETGRIKPFQRTCARFQAASTYAYGNLFVQNRSKLLF